jgi:uncharacterized membrane protein YciS (DUF1049 family)
VNTTALTLGFALIAITTGGISIMLQLQLNKTTKKIQQLEAAREQAAAALTSQIKINVNLLSLAQQTDDRLIRLEIKGATN